MKTNIRTIAPLIVTAITLFAASGQAMAERGDLSVTGKFGKTKSDISVPGDAGTPLPLEGETAFGANVGYAYDDNWTVEFQYIKTEANNDGLNIKGDLSSIGLFGVYRTAQELASPYFLGRLGYSKVDGDAKQGNLSLPLEASGLSFGAGVGYKFSDTLAFEAEYIVDAQDLSYIMISARYSLGQQF